MKLDIKSIIILVMITLCGFFAWKYYNETNSDYKKELNKLRDENKIIQQKRDSLLVIRKELEHRNTFYIQENNKLMAQSLYLEKEANEQKSKANKSKVELERIINELKETQKKIEELKNKPANRTDEDLLNSLKLKSKK